MGFFNFLSRSQAKVNQVSKEQNVPIESTVLKDPAGSPEAIVTVDTSIVESQAPHRRFSLRSLNFTRKDHEVHVAILPAIKEQEKREDPSMPSNNKVSSADKRAKNSALALRSLIVGPTSTLASQNTAMPSLSKIRSQLLEPNVANKVIASLKELPACDDPLHADKTGAKGPIHAVCLAYTDAEADALQFSKLKPESGEGEVASLSGLPNMFSVPVDKVASLFSDMSIIDLINAPDFIGLGEPGDGPGILSGALPTAETVIEGVVRITPELMTLGFATGKAIMPDHSGIFPPTDRMSVLTYWWGLELLLPSASLVYLGTAESITNAVMNFLTALALIDNGVREILPFIRYISQFVGFEFNAIRGQDKGKGVICAATWLVPIALVPRPWDFLTRPIPTIVPDTSHNTPVENSNSPKVTIEQSDDATSPSIPHDKAEVPDTSPKTPVENPKDPAESHETSPLA